jgi:hypothetical protein
MCAFIFADKLVLQIKGNYLIELLAYQRVKTVNKILSFRLVKKAIKVSQKR